MAGTSPGKEGQEQSYTKAAQSNHLACSAVTPPPYPHPFPNPQVVNVAATFSDVWRQVSATIAELDVLAAFAEVAASAPTPYVRPVMLPSEGERVCTLPVGGHTHNTRTQPVCACIGDACGGALQCRSTVLC